jgi:hypothetical protein
MPLTCNAPRTGGSAAFCWLYVSVRLSRPYEVDSFRFQYSVNGPEECHNNKSIHQPANVGGYQGTQCTFRLQVPENKPSNQHHGQSAKQQVASPCDIISNLPCTLFSYSPSAPQPTRNEKKHPQSKRDYSRYCHGFQVHEYTRILTRIRFAITSALRNAADFYNTKAWRASG